MTINDLTVKIYFKGKHISKATAEERFGKDRIKNRLNEAIQAYFEDPYEICEWMDGMKIIVTA